jgi:hypothetical protein
VTFLFGLLLHATGLLILSLAQPRDGKQPTFMKSEVIGTAVMLLVIVLVLGGLGIIIGSVANLVDGGRV